ncbi:hypothetical protein EDD17DRAFT_1539968 [Pisolithus thermaeus]|nr:hypothetical protein EDD17DRAFT_1539968 [Pisolithus thermaeus]
MTASRIKPLIPCIWKCFGTASQLMGSMQATPSGEVQRHGLYGQLAYSLDAACLRGSLSTWIASGGVWDLFTRVRWWSNPTFFGTMSAYLSGRGVGLRWAGINQAVYLMIRATPVSGYTAGWRAGGRRVWSGKAGGPGGRHMLWKAELHVPSKSCYALSREPMGTGVENEGRSNTVFQGRGTSFRIQLHLVHKTPPSLTEQLQNSSKNTRITTSG